jgi:hypothetical protein
MGKPEKKPLAGNAGRGESPLRARLLHGIPWEKGTTTSRVTRRISAVWTVFFMGTVFSFHQEDNTELRDCLPFNVWKSWSVNLFYIEPRGGKGTGPKSGRRL